MKWKVLNEVQQLDQIAAASNQHPVLIFKHSTRCSISSSALARIERQEKGAQLGLGLETWFLDLIEYRSISNEIAKKFGIEHQSPQVLLIVNGQCVYDASHMDIVWDEVVGHVKVKV